MKIIAQNVLLDQELDNYVSFPPIIISNIVSITIIDSAFSIIDVSLSSGDHFLIPFDDETTADNWLALFISHFDDDVTLDCTEYLYGCLVSSVKDIYMNVFKVTMKTELSSAAAEAKCRQRNLPYDVSSLVVTKTANQSGKVTSMPLSSMSSFGGSRW